MSLFVQVSIVRVDLYYKGEDPIKFARHVDSLTQLHTSLVHYFSGCAAVSDRFRRTSMFDVLLFECMLEYHKALLSNLVAKHQNTIFVRNMVNGHSITAVTLVTKCRVLINISWGLWGTASTFLSHISMNIKIEIFVTIFLQ